MGREDCLEIMKNQKGMYAHAMSVAVRFCDHKGEFSSCSDCLAKDLIKGKKNNQEKK
ncbi:MAG: hypothetical protein ABIG29_00285 [Candidatus Nealsonbacteria bacterium]